MSSKTATLLIAIFIFFGQVLLAASREDYNTAVPSGDKSIDNSTYINANNILMFVTNHGNFGRDLSDVFGYGAGTFYPYISIDAIESGQQDSYVLYAAGIWVGGLVNGEVRATIAEYSDEYVPGPMIDGTYSPDNPSYHVYKIYSDSLGSNPNNSYLNWPADQGAPVLPDGSPKTFGDQTLWSVFNDANPSQHHNNAGSTAPLGIEVRQTVWGSRDDNVYDTVLNVGEAQILHAGDADIALTIEIDDVTQILDGQQYVVTFDDAGDGSFVWNIIDETYDIVKVQDRPYPTGGNDAVAVDGLNFVLSPLQNGIEKIEEIANGDGILGSPDNVMYSLNSTGDWYVSSDAGSDFSRMNWRGLMGESDWEIRFTYDGSQYYDWNTDQLQPDRAPFEVWNIGEGTPDNTYDDVRINFSFIDDDNNAAWSWGDRVYPWEKPYVEPAPAIPNYVWDGDFKIGRIVFNDYSGTLMYPAEGTIVRFTSYKITPISEMDTIYVTAPSVYVDYVGEESDEIYIAYEVINKGENTIEDCYIALWSDPDLGGAGDDLVGCDPEDNLFFCYNGDGNDQQYGLNPPAIGFKVISGPLVSAPGETADYFGKSIPDHRNLGLAAFGKYYGGTDPDNAQETYNYMRGLLRDGSPYYYGGVQTTFINSGDPVNGTGDLDYAPSDRRMMGSFGPITMNPGDSQFVLIKMAVGRSGDYLSSITDLREKLNRPFSYPEDIYPPKTWHVTLDGNDTDGDGSEGNPFATIQHAVDVALSGDRVLIHSGIYTGEGNRDILVQGKELNFGGVGLTDSIAINCQGSEAEPHLGIKFQDCPGTSTLENLTITNAYRDGYARYSAVESRNSNLKIQSCHIVDNEATGVLSLYETGTLEIYNSDISRNQLAGVNSLNLSLKINDCRIADNKYGGIGSYGFSVRNNSIYNSEISGNGNFGLEIEYPSNAYVAGNTIVDNSTGFTYFIEPPKTADTKTVPIVMVNRNIFAYNEYFGVVETFASTPIIMGCNLFFNNSLGDLSGLEFDGDDHDNLFESPGFCSAEGGNYYLHDYSPCLPENNDCGAQIGAYGLSEDDCGPIELINLIQWRKDMGGNDHWYAVYPEALFWNQADSAAETRTHGEDGTGYLATILSPEENAFILDSVLKQLEPPTISGEFWLGGRDLLGINSWSWITGEPFLYENWGPTEPNNIGVETALSMWGPINTNPRIPGTWNNSLPDDNINQLHQYWSVVEFGEPEPGMIHPTNEWVNLYCDAPMSNNVPLNPGDVIRAYDTDMHLCGMGVVDSDGAYGFMPVYRDFPGSAIDEGMDPGETIRFSLNGVEITPSTPVLWTEMGDRIQVCTFTNMQTRSISLYTGWNLVSWNLDNDEEDIIKLLIPIMNNVELVMGFEAGGLTFDPQLPEFSTLSELDHYHGYWFKMKAPSHLLISGYPVSHGDKIVLEQDWNLISYWPPDGLTVPSALGEIYPYINLVLGWRDGVPQTYDPSLPDYSTLDYMASGYGYWVRMTQPAFLSYQFDMPKAAPKLFATPADYVSRIWTNVYSRSLTLDGETVPSGTPVTAIGSEDRVLGAGTVDENGKFGFMAVYGDDPMTKEIDGIRDGEEYYLKVGEVNTSERFVWSTSNPVVEIPELKSADVLPEHFALAQNYPNPFNPDTRIEFSLPQSSHVTLAVYDILGRKVAILADDQFDAGKHEVTWNGKNELSQQVASGVYFYRMKAGDFEQSRKMLLVK